MWTGYRLSFVALIVVLASAVFSFVLHSMRTGASLAPVAVYLSVVSKRRRIQVLQSLRLVSYYERGQRRVGGNWVDGENTGAELGFHDDGGLGVFGRGSLFQKLCTCRTKAGQRRLAEYLSREAPPVAEIRERQRAISELRERADIRERMEVLGSTRTSSVERGTYAGFWEETIPPVGRSLQIGALLSSVVLLLLLLAAFARALSFEQISWIAGPLAGVHLTIAMLYRERVRDDTDRSVLWAREIPLVPGELAILQAERFESTLLCELQAKAQGDHQRALRKLGRILRTFGECNK